MTSLKAKTSVRPYSLVIACAVINAAQKLAADGVGGVPKDILITAGTDGQHMAGSKHYSGEALDIRSKTFGSAATKRAFIAEIQRRLGRDYTVLLEYEGESDEHIHIERDP